MAEKDCRRTKGKLFPAFGNCPDWLSANTHVRQTISPCPAAPRHISDTGQQAHNSPETLSFTKFCRGQQCYKAYSLGLFRGKCSGFVRFYVPGNNRFSQVLYSENVRFCQVLMPRKSEVLWGSYFCRLANMQQFPRFSMFYKLKIKVFLGLSFLTIYNPAAGIINE